LGLLDRRRRFGDTRLSIHQTAIIDPQAEIDSSVEIGPHCIIEGNVRIEAGCRLYQGVYATGWTTIGADCVLHPGVIVGHEPQDAKYDGARTYCRVGRGTVLREHVTVHRGTTPESETLIGEDCFLLANSHVGHNCDVGSRVTMINGVVLGGHVSVGAGATLGGYVGVHQFVRIGELVMIAGQARVVRDVVPFALADIAGGISGLNRIGLRRAGVSPDEVAQIRDVYRTVFARGVSFTDGVEGLESDPDDTPRGRLVRFLRGTSQRGVAGRCRCTVTRV
jgi:UDP-N-acetylglucosamine acyltransferase